MAKSKKADPTKSVDLEKDWSSIEVTLTAKGLDEKVFGIEHARRTMSHPTNNRPGGWKAGPEAAKTIVEYEKYLEAIETAANAEEEGESMEIASKDDHMSFSGGVNN